MKAARILLVSVAFAASLVLAVYAEEKKKFSERVKEFSAAHQTPEAIDTKLKELAEKEPASPDPYILAANAYLSIASSMNILPKVPEGEFTIKEKGGGFAIVDPKTQQQVGTISRGKDVALIKKAGTILGTASTKFPHRLDIFVGRMSVAERAGDLQALQSAGIDMIKACQAHPDKMKWLDDAPLTEPLPDKIVSELQGRIKELYEEEKDEADEVAYKLATEGLRMIPNSVRLLNDVAAYHTYKNDWQKAREFLMKAEKADDKDLLIKLNLARAHLKCGEPEAARKKYGDVIKAAPKSDEADAARKAITELPKKKSGTK